MARVDFNGQHGCRLTLWKADRWQRFKKAKFRKRYAKRNRQSDDEQEGKYEKKARIRFYTEANVQSCVSFFRLHRGMEVLLERSCCCGGMGVYRSITYRFFASLFFLQCVLCSTLKMRHLTSATVRTTWIGYLCCYVPATLLLRIFLDYIIELPQLSRN